MIAATIFIVVIGLVGGMFVKSLTYYSDSQTAASGYGMIKRVVNIFSDDISSMLTIRHASLKEKQLFKGEESAIYFLYPSAEGLKELAYVYDAGKRQLLKRSSENNYDFFSYEKEDVVARDVELVEFSYYDGSKWNPLLSDVFPHAVKLRMKIKRDRFEQEINETVHIPTVN